MSDELDQDFGVPRKPEKVDVWEQNIKPLSLSRLEDAANTLKSLTELADQALVQADLRVKTFLWVMDGNGEIFVAIEELAPKTPAAPHSGFPRRRAFGHPAEEKKLGHPTLIDAGEARIAGEIAFDRQQNSSSLQLVLNANSGRYCRQNPPSRQQVHRIADKFRAYGLAIEVDTD